MKVDFSLYLITDRHQIHPQHTLISAVTAALQGGVQAIQLREKDLSATELYRLGSALRELTNQYGAKLLINDRIDIAMAVGADGVHLTEQSLDVTCARTILGNDKLIAVSTHNLTSALHAEKQGADLITFSPIFFTPSKAAYGDPQGLEQLHTLCQQLKLPVFALGGITTQRVAPVVAAGATGVALISAILAQENPCHAAADFKISINQV
ncbi:MAG: thiamine-phosphate diphosphorylase [Desulfobacteraceae bacterium 4572_35.1]|nr:MAG: thiamine-phosphate diphosphorylase [Desulfobacteraceae bacterium 4572_35.1]